MVLMRPILILGIVSLSVLSVSSNSANQRKGECVWYDECGKGGRNKKQLNCKYLGPPKPLTDKEGLKHLKTYCPHLLNNDGNRTTTCCSGAQMKTFHANLNGLIKSLLSKCPACWRNYRYHLCSLTCVPSHGHYLAINGTTINKKNQTQITDMIYFISNKFANGLYDSCKNVKMPWPYGNSSVMRIICGQWGEAKCNAHRWLQYMGSTDNGEIPFELNSVFSDDSAVDYDGLEYYPLNIPTYKCGSKHKEDGKDLAACKCKDCSESGCASN